METKPCNVIVNYLPQNITDKELYSMFLTTGHVKDCKIMRDAKTGYSYGFGFVNYSSPEGAARAIQQLNGQEFYNKRIKVSYARPSGEDIQNTNLYVTNIPKHYTEEDIESVFSAYGEIVQTKRLMDKITRLPRGVAFVRYNHKEEALRAIENLNGLVLPGGNETLTVKIAEAHGKMKAAYYAGFHAAMNLSARNRNGNPYPRGAMRGGGAMRGHGAMMGHNGAMRGHGGAMRGHGGPMRGHGGATRGCSLNMSYNHRPIPVFLGQDRGGFTRGSSNQTFDNRHSLFSGFNKNFTDTPGPVRQDKILQRYNPIFCSTESLTWSHNGCNGRMISN